MRAGEGLGLGSLPSPSLGAWRPWTERRAALSPTPVPLFVDARAIKRGARTTVLVGAGESRYTEAVAKFIQTPEKQ